MRMLSVAPGESGRWDRVWTGRFETTETDVRCMEGTCPCPGFKLCKSKVKVTGM